MAKKRKKPTSAQISARKEYQRIRKNIRNKQYYYRKKYGLAPTESLPSVLPKGLTAREYKRAAKELKQYEKRMYEQKAPDKVDILVNMIRAKIARIPLPTRELGTGEVSGRDLISNWFENAISIFGKSAVVKAVSEAEENGYPLDESNRYSDNAEEFINEVMQHLSPDNIQNEYMNDLQQKSEDWNDVL